MRGRTLGRRRDVGDRAVGDPDHTVGDHGARRVHGDHTAPQAVPGNGRSWHLCQPSWSAALLRRGERRGFQGRHPSGKEQLEVIRGGPTGVGVDRTHSAVPRRPDPARRAIGQVDAGQLAAAGRQGERRVRQVPGVRAARQRGQRRLPGGGEPRFAVRGDLDHLRAGRDNGGREPARTGAHRQHRRDTRVGGQHAAQQFAVQRLHLRGRRPETTVSPGSGRRCRPAACG